MIVCTAIVLDELGTFGETPAQERDQILADLAEEGIEVKLVHFGHNPLDLPATSIDLLIVDYGALSMAGMHDWTRGLLVWAEAHPGSLVALWSSMTADLFANELAPFNDAVGWYDTPVWPDNLVALHPGSSHRMDWGRSSMDWLDQSWAKIRAWFGATPAPKPKLTPPGRTARSEDLT